MSSSTRAGKFNRGSNAGTATCGTCGRIRQKANMERVGGMPICNDCWDMAGDENAVQDGYMTAAEFEARWGSYQTKYGI